MFFTAADEPAESAKLRSHAMQHSLTVVMTNFGCPSGGPDSGGGSAIWSAEGELLGRIEGGRSGVVAAHESETGWEARVVMLESSHGSA